ncbi:MAG: hypothetical protein V1808_03335 [Candidatus Daviesbacteria bacterium]
MRSSRVSKKSLRKIKTKGTNPLVAQVKKLLADADQRLILMVRG